MNKYDISEFLKLLFQDTHIPYVFGFVKNGTFHPEIQSEYLTNIMINDFYIDFEIQKNNVTYAVDPNGIYYGFIKLESNNDSLLILGPISPTTLLEKDSRILFKYNNLSFDGYENYKQFLSNIPTYSLGAFLHKLIFINYCLNHKSIHTDDLYKITPENTMASSITEDNWNSNEFELNRMDWKIEDLLMDAVRSGNVEAIKNITYNADNHHVGTIAPTQLRALKNSLISTTTLITHAAITGGLEYNTANNLSDSYMYQIEITDDSEKLYNLYFSIAINFTELVADLRVPDDIDETLKKAIRHIRNNIHHRLSVEDVAKHVGFSTTYFCALFKKNLGFSIHSFLLRCRLEESIKLLRYTNKTLNEISLHLNFSSQSHFQRSFKNQYGITPLNYRKTHQII